MKKDRISIALSKPLIKKVEAKCRRLNRNRSNYIETLLIEDLQKDEPEQPKQQEEYAMKFG